MSKFKAKLTALLMAAVCCLACVGIGISIKKSNEVVVNAVAETVEYKTVNVGPVGRYYQKRTKEKKYFFK